MNSGSNDVLSEVSDHYLGCFSNTIELLGDYDLLDYSPDVHNQVRMAYSHLMRCYTVETADVDREKRKAKDHLTRGALDAHKTIYYGKLSKIRSNLASCTDVPIERIMVSEAEAFLDMLDRCRKESRKSYEAAKRYESDGDHKKALKGYRNAIDIQDEVLANLAKADTQIAVEKIEHEKNIANAKKLAVSATLRIVTIAIGIVAAILLTILPIPYEELFKALFGIGGNQ